MSSQPGPGRRSIRVETWAVHLARVRQCKEMTMNNSEMSTEQKSLILFRLVGWLQPAGDEYREGVFKFDTNDALGGALNGSFVSDSEQILAECLNLYGAANMALAWRVLNWAHANLRVDSARGVGSFLEFWASPEKAQAVWLDKILSLAIEAGLVETAVTEAQL